MKVHIEIDCTPVEARIFLGLPDIKPLQDHLVQSIEERLQASLKAIDVEYLFKTWLPNSIHGLEKAQSALWAQFVSSLEKHVNNNTGQNDKC